MTARSPGWMGQEKHLTRFIADLEDGGCVGELGDIAEQVYLRHVLRSIAAQGKKAVA